MIEYLKRSWAVVNLDAVANNIRAIQAKLSPNCKVMAVVKADAYGHGDKFIADQLVALGVQWFGVSNFEEAVSLRVQGIFHPILIFGITPPSCAKQINEYNLTQTIHSLEYANILHVAANDAGVDINVHIKVDTGMSRLGFCENAVEEISEICKLPRFHSDGIYTHFACGEELDDDPVEFTRGQFEKFMAIIKILEQKGHTFAIKHCCNSGATVNHPEMHLDMVRPGILLYGLSPNEKFKDKIDLMPAMSLYSTVTQVKKIPIGATVGYNRFYTAHRDTIVATVSIGYADGYERELSNKAKVLVHGVFANVIGRVCMDQLMLDVTHISGVTAGDLVTIVGNDNNESLTFDEMAQLSGTIAYEKICLIGKRVPRIYRRNGKDVGVVDYTAWINKK